MLDLLYSQLARARRRYYQRRPHLRRRLAAPVISIGNLTVGGSGKTPLAAEIARMLLEMGERPSILSRGYARKIFDEGVVIVSDGSRVLADVERSGDEPQMLARAVPRAAVLVSSSRYVAGRIAESRLGCTVHVLDDGFQHFDLMRDIDLLVAPDASDERARFHSAGFASRSMRPRPPMRCWWTLMYVVRSRKASRPLDSAEDLARQTPCLYVFPPPRRAGARIVPAFAFAGIARPAAFLRRSRKGRLEADRPPVVRRSSSLFGVGARRDRARGDILGRCRDPHDRKRLSPFGV